MYPIEHDAAGIRSIGAGGEGIASELMVGQDGLGSICNRGGIWAVGVGLSSTSDRAAGVDSISDVSEVRTAVMYQRQGI